MVARQTSVYHLPSAVLVKSYFLFCLLIGLVSFFLSVFTSTFGSRFYYLHFPNAVRPEREGGHTFVQHKPAKPTRMLRIFASDIKKKCRQLRVEAPFSRY